MPYLLIKMSETDFEKKFDNEDDLRHELFQHICNSCMDAYDVNITSPLYEILGTPCGCEFWIEEGEDNEGDPS